ncbi:unnamed protein product [Merluccius merluccius]
MDQSNPNPTRGGTPQIAIPGKQPGGPPVGRGSLGTRSSGAEDESTGGAGNSYGRSPVAHGMQAYLEGKGANGTLSSSPRSPSTRGSYAPRGGAVRAKLPQGPRQENPNKENGAAKSPAAPRQPAGRGRTRTSSENERGGKGGRGPAHRKRGLSETEVTPRRDNINMSGLQCLATENIWFDKHHYDDAERSFYEGPNSTSTQEKDASAILQAIAKSQQNIQQFLDSEYCKLMGRPSPISGSTVSGSVKMLIMKCKATMFSFVGLTFSRVEVEDMRALIRALESRVTMLEKTQTTAAPIPFQAAPQKKVEVDDDDEDDDLDLFGSDEEDAETTRIKQERIDSYAAKKAKKPVLIAKSSILLDVKPWDDETDMAKLEECVRSVQADGLLWGASKFLPVGYGIRKLQINCVVEDDKVGTDLLEEEITKFEDYVQSVDVAAFNKI